MVRSTIVCRLVLLLLLVQVMSFAPAQAQSGAPAVKAKPGASDKNSAKGNAKPSPSQKTTTTGFSFLVEPVPAWVIPVASDASAPLQSGVALQFGLIDEQINLDGKTSYYHHVERRIASTAGLGQGAQIQIEFDPSYQELAMHKVEIVRQAQRIDKLDVKRVQLLQRETQLEARIYDGRITASMVLDDVRAGDRIEYSYTVRGSNPVFDGKFVLIKPVGTASGPVALRQLRVLYPASRTLQFRVPKMVQVEQRQDGGKQELLLRQNNVPQSTFESHAPAWAYINDIIQISEFADWNEVARWAAGLFAATTSSPRIEQQVASWRSSTSDPAQQLQLALDFVQKDVRYFGTEIGVNSHKPATPDKVLTQRFGDCKDKAGLLIATLKALGVEAQPVLVSNTFQDRADLLLPNPLAFDHVIARVQQDGKSWWIDATRDQQTGPLAQRQVLDYGKVLLAVDGAKALQALPTGSKQVFQTVEDRFNLTEMNADPLLTSTITYHGILAEYMRTWLARTPLPEVQTHLAKPYLRPFPKMTVAAPLRVVELKDQNALQVIQEFSVPNLWTVHELEQIKAETLLWSLEDALEHPHDVVRKQPLHIEYPGIYRHNVIVEFNEDLVDAAKDEKWSDGQANFLLNMVYKKAPRRLSVDAELQFSGNTVEPGQWRSYTEKVKQIRPRLFPDIHAHLLNKPQLAALEKEIENLFKFKSWREVVGEHDTHKIVVLYANAMIQSNRLNPALFADVMRMRGEAFRGLGLYDKSTTDIQSALKQAQGENPALLVSAGVTELFQSHDAAALEFANKALEQAPHDKGAHKLKLMIAYHSGDYKTAKGVLDEAFAAESGDEFGDLVLLRYLLARQLGEDGKAELRAVLEKTDAKKWHYTIMQYFLGEIDFKKASLPFSTRNTYNMAGLCALYFYAGEKARLDGNLKLAREYLQNTTAMNLHRSYENNAAKRQLARLPAEN